MTIHSPGLRSGKMDWMFSFLIIPNMLKLRRFMGMHNIDPDRWNKGITKAVGTFFDLLIVLVLIVALITCAFQL